MQYIMFVLGIVFALLIWKVVNKYNLFNKYNKYVVLVVMSLLIAVVLEIFTFNYSAFAGKKTEHFALDIATEDRKSTRQNSSHGVQSRMPSSA